jgi:hypothetical protein
MHLARGLFACVGKGVLAEERDSQDAEGAAAFAMQEPIRERLATQGRVRRELGEIDAGRRHRGGELPDVVQPRPRVEGGDNENGGNGVDHFTSPQLQLSLH